MNKNFKLELKPIGEHSYSWAEGFTTLANKQENEGGNRMIDWDKIKSIIESEEFERIEVGLAEDYYQTHATIFKDGEKIIKENDSAGFYGYSRWATPAVKLTKDGQTGLFECWTYGEDSTFPKWMNDYKRIYE